MKSTHQLLDVITQGKITPDAKQQEALLILQSISDELLVASKDQETANSHLPHKEFKPQHSHQLQQPQHSQQQRSQFSFLSFFTKAKKQQRKTDEIRFLNTVKGMYIWGDVGRGKTWLMDQFYDYLPLKKKRRIHFHEFMLQVHKKLQDLPSQSNPLALVGKQMANEVQVLCLDEFHVMDIADAVILHGLLKALFENGVTVITTSNRQPDDLYKNGSHRERFLPAIELIKNHTTVFHFDKTVDYRLLRQAQKHVFYIPHDESTDQQLKIQFGIYVDTDLVNSHISTDKTISILGRDIPVHMSGKGCVWFGFDTLCKGMRSSNDYIQIAKRYKTVILSEVPELHEGEEGPARRFLNLIDAFYDQHVFLILSSYIELKEIYTGSLLVFEFKRALSRLHEMQSESWWLDMKIKNKNKQVGTSN